MQASPNLNFDSEHNFDSDTVLLIDLCRRLTTGCYREQAQTQWAHTMIAAGQVLKWLKRASPGDMRAVREIGVQLGYVYDAGEYVDRILILDIFAGVMSSYAIRCLSLFRDNLDCVFRIDTEHNVFEMLSKCAELGFVAAMLILASMYFECKNTVVRHLLETYGVNSATALEYLLKAAYKLQHDCKANVLLGKLHLQGPDGEHGQPKYLPVGVKSPVPFNVEKSLDHFKKAIESYDAMAEPKLLLTMQIPEQYLGAFNREQVLKFVCIIGNMYMDMCTCTKCVPCNLPNDPKRSRNIFKWAASKGCLPAVAVLGGAKPKCAHCGGNNPSKHCPGCLCTKYCSKECQRKHWSHHKGECRTALLDVCQVF